MATPANSKCKDFICPYPHPLAAGTDLFLQDLRRWEAVYVFPPFNMILKVFRLLKEFRGKIIFVAPLWPNQPWFSPLQKRATNVITLSQPPSQTIGGEIFTLPSKRCSRIAAWIF